MVLLDKLDKEETRQTFRDQDLFFRLMFRKIEKKKVILKTMFHILPL